MHKHLLAFLITILLLTASVHIGTQAQTEPQDQYNLQLQKFAWDKSSLNVLVVPPQNETWWNPLYLNSTIQAINQWNQATVDFAVNYTDFSYLSRLSLIPTVANETKKGFDVSLSWTEHATRDSADEIGLTVITSDQFSKIVKTTINLAAKNKNNISLTEIDMQNIALHELGHVLGLAHSNYTGDIMYSTYTLNSQVRAISTLDVYGVAIMFQWMKNPASFYPVSSWLKISTVTSPSDIEYKLLMSDYNQPTSILPDPSVQNNAKIILSLLRPEIISIVLLLSLIGLIILFRASKKTWQGSKS